jgi:hypothetical protein
VIVAIHHHRHVERVERGWIEFELLVLDIKGRGLAELRTPRQQHAGDRLAARLALRGIGR